jgi:deazaflavin-dependent oxidoreductase (nitroreductase family)
VRVARDAFSRWAYRGGRPNRVAAILNRAWATIHGWGLLPNYLVTLEVKGRRTGRVVTLPLVMALVDGERYVVSMLGDRIAWVKNVRAAGGKAVLRHGRREEVRFVDVPVEERARIVKAYLARAPGARPHISVDKDAPLEEFEKIVREIPVFRVLAAG